MSGLATGLVFRLMLAETEADRNLPAGHRRPEPLATARRQVLKPKVYSFEPHRIGMLPVVY